MRRNQIVKADFLIAVLLMVSILLVAGLAGCSNVNGGGTAAKQSLTGEWRGTLKVDGDRIAVDLKFKDGEPPRLHYGVERSCWLKAESTGTEGRVSYYKFKEGSGPWCDRLRKGGQMTFTLNDNGTADLHVTNAGKGIDEKIELTKE